MDLSFPGFDKDREVVRLPGDLAVLMNGIAARQAISPTARAGLAQPGLGDADLRLLAPLDGAFNGPMATALMRWKDE